MLDSKNINLAIKVLSTFEEAYYPNRAAVADIEDGLFWNATGANGRGCFSADLGFLLRGDAENVRIYESVEDYLNNRVCPINHIDAVIVENSIYIIEAVDEQF